MSTPIWKNDDELIALAKKELFTALVGDSLDKINLRHQFLPAQVKPLSPEMVVLGRAMPVVEADVYDEIVENTKNELMSKPFGLMFEALDSLQKNEVYICTGGSHNYAMWGGLMSTRAIKCGAAGAVVDGYSRDTNEILRLNFPTCSIGTYAQDQGPRGKVIDYGVPIIWNGIKINPGDWVYGDRDGVVIIPKEVEEQVFTLAFEKARGEKSVLKALEGGMTTVEAFEKFGIM
ncbi:RraA family protein [Flavivirga amylovorans]|uniref:Putative 4-hydroxy-4-methyl-2-oxoglutarate aldolase n=1 Tax=Flavivirga amylovorans TaxID=870486 RepID=A0ABT8WXG5_9FLAO|nr:RraA family protein [Flavivirga amylovorans]MDO5986168.1 RraA family protein [Flavivirga amylovorans]